MTATCELVGVAKSYKGRMVLEGVDLVVEQGEFVAIAGPSGCGKTTLLNLVGLLERPDQGSIHLFGNRAPRPGSAQATRLLRYRIGYLFQSFALIEGESVDYNLRLALAYTNEAPTAKRRRIASVLRRVGMEAMEARKVYELSGGEQQRLAVARLMVKPCDLVLADEPTGSLDAANRDEVVRLLRELQVDGKTTLLVTHDMDVAKAADRVIELSRPRLGDLSRAASC